MRRIQGLCLILLGVLLGWFAGGELSTLSKGDGIGTGDLVFVGAKLLIGLASLFVGLLFVVGVPWSQAEETENVSSHGSAGERHRLHR
jgi:hypothetical protein